MTRTTSGRCPRCAIRWTWHKSMPRALCPCCRGSLQRVTADWRGPTRSVSLDIIIQATIRGPLIPPRCDKKCLQIGTVV